MKTPNAFIGAISACLLLSGCVSLGAGVEPPESLLTLTSADSAPVGSGAVSGVEGSEGAIAVLTLKCRRNWMCCAYL